jgi:hypothetical protein
MSAAAIPDYPHPETRTTPRPEAIDSTTFKLSQADLNKSPEEVFEVIGKVGEGCALSFTFDNHCFLGRMAPFTRQFIKIQGTHWRSRKFQLTRICKRSSKKSRLCSNVTAHS